jgi:hypothetical protein
MDTGLSRSRAKHLLSQTYADTKDVQAELKETYVSLSPAELKRNMIKLLGKLEALRVAP